MARTHVFLPRAVCVIGLFLNVNLLRAQMNMPGMAAMENSVGFLSSGTSVEPTTTSESLPMIHKTIGGWTWMFHANGFLIDTQQSGPRGRDAENFRYQSYVRNRDQERKQIDGEKSQVVKGVGR